MMHRRSFALIAAIFVSPLALYGCADSGAGAGSATDSGSSTGSSSGGADGGSSGGSSGGDGAASSSGSSGSSSNSSSGGETQPIDLLTEVQKAVDYKNCVQFTNKSKGVTVRNLTVASLRKYVSKNKDGIYVQQKGGGSHGGLLVTGEVKSVIADLKIGDVVTVTGDNKGFYCAQQLDAELVNKEKGTELPTAATVTVDKIGEGADLTTNQKWENGLVQIENVVVVDTVGDKKDFGNVYVGKTDSDKALILTTVRDKGWSNGLGVYDWDTKKWAMSVKKGDKLKVVRGIIAFSFNHWRLLPTHIEK